MNAIVLLGGCLCVLSVLGSVRQFWWMAYDDK